MKRILVFGMTENPGGVESFLLNYYRNIDRDRIQFDFLCNSHNPVAYEKELIELGGRTYHITARSKNPFLYKKELEHVFNKHASEWSAIWVNVSSLANIDYLKIAKRYGIERRIIHSHNSQNMDSKLRGFLHRWNKKSIEKWATDFWACSEKAAKWFYKDELRSKTVVIHNAIDVGSISYNEEKRKAIRNKIGVTENTYVIGNIGRLHFQKNQGFAISVFREYLKKNSDTRLVLVGQGEDESLLKERASDISDKVIFTGVQSDIQGWLSAFDLFLFPSLFEGLSISAMEAQGNGVPILASETVIPEEVRIASNFKFFSLDHTAEEWAEMIMEIKSEYRRNEENEIRQAFNKKGFDISSEARRLERLLV